jgi:hypothetical protein
MIFVTHRIRKKYAKAYISVYLILKGVQILKYDLSCMRYWCG